MSWTGKRSCHVYLGVYRDQVFHSLGVLFRGLLDCGLCIMPSTLIRAPVYGTTNWGFPKILGPFGAGVCGVARGRYVRGRGFFSFHVFWRSP